jgi:hypothetical protein
MGLLSSSKDRLAETMAASLLNKSLLKPYGRIVELKLNSSNKALEVTLELKGEQEWVRIDIQEYELIREDGRCFIIIKRAATSREWLTALAEELAIGKRLEVPAGAAKIVSQFL